MHSENMTRNLPISSKIGFTVIRLIDFRILEEFPLPIRPVDKKGRKEGGREEV